MQWNQLDHMQTICTSLGTQLAHQYLITRFLQAECSSWHSSESVKALKHMEQLSPRERRDDMPPPMAVRYKNRGGSKSVR